MTQQQYGTPEPWYAPSRKKARGAGGLTTPGQEETGAGGKNEAGASSGATLGLFASGLFALVSALAAGALVAATLLQRPPTGLTLAAMGGGLALTAISVLFVLRQVGVVAARLSRKHADDPPIKLSLGVARGDVIADDTRRGPPAPEMALYQFVQQVRAYATEKAFQKNRHADGRPETAPLLVAEPVDLLKRRWNEVLDSLNEFEIYLANDPQGMIEKLIAKHPTQLADVSQVFREVAESFDNTWRRKGINIESAIVTPLKAHTNDALLRRLLVGPWRASAYFARRGNSVVFSAKSVSGKIVARWETEGLAIREDYVKIALDTKLPVNERIERGLAIIAADPNSGNTLHALVSFITWIDLATACAADFEFKHTNDGFVVELRLK